MAPGVSIARVAMAHGINANQLHKWRYLYKKGEFGPMHRPSKARGFVTSIVSTPGLK
jgi:transposase